MAVAYLAYHEPWCRGASWPWAMSPCFHRDENIRLQAAYTVRKTQTWPRVHCTSEGWACCSDMSHKSSWLASKIPLTRAKSLTNSTKPSGAQTLFLKNPTYLKLLNKFLNLYTNICQNDAG